MAFSDFQKVENDGVIGFCCASDRSAALCGDEAGDLVLPWSCGRCATTPQARCSHLHTPGQTCHCQSDAIDDGLAGDNRGKGAPGLLILASPTVGAFNSSARTWGDAWSGFGGEAKPVVARAALFLDSSACPGLRPFSCSSRIMKPGGGAPY
jgi:hypothetical protein